ncbi:MAG: hypothetical protein K8R74_01065 [Bacteroidales bacterium]|nr:hypothetical protein [Bacteroidales bacterium]
MKKRSFFAIALATLFLGATLSVFAADNTGTKNTNGTAMTSPDGNVGANDVSGVFVPD